MSLTYNVVTTSTPIPAYTLAADLSWDLTKPAKVKRKWAGPWRLVEVTYRVRGELKPRVTWVRPYAGLDGRWKLHVGPTPLAEGGIVSKRSGWYPA